MQEQKRIAFYPIIIGESVSQTREVHIILTQSHLKHNYNEHFASKMDFLHFFMGGCHIITFASVFTYVLNS